MGRELGFRGTRDPYAILVSEVMAQQTQIARAEQYWRVWMARFPTIEALAAATPADVLRAWQGLGYDRRALNLLRCAREVVASHGGRLPTAIADLERLPGLGPYTARALAALAFGQRVGAVDVNVRRVVGRIVGGPDGARVDGHGSAPGRGRRAGAGATSPAAGRTRSWTSGDALPDPGAPLRGVPGPALVCGRRRVGRGRAGVERECRARALARRGSVPPRSRRPAAGCVGGSSTGFGRRRTTVDRHSRGRSASTTPRRWRRPSGRWRREGMVELAEAAVAGVRGLEPRRAREAVLRARLPAR